jgi:transposase-like protein
MGAMEPPAAAPGAGDDEVTCPWCDSDQVEQVGVVGPTVMTSSWICNDCHTPFERIRRR